MCYDKIIETTTSSPMRTSWTQFGDLADDGLNELRKAAQWTSSEGHFRSELLEQVFRDHE
jgi:hypothetical protein